VSFTQLFRFATRVDIILMILGTVASIITGTAIPVFAYISGSMIDAFQVSGAIYEEARKNLYYYIILGVAAGAMAMVMFTGWTIAGERQSM
jgi:ATP-binding cassette subfamily B (MDR/TAP) protein 1